MGSNYNLYPVYVRTSITEREIVFLALKTLHSRCQPRSREYSSKFLITIILQLYNTIIIKNDHKYNNKKKHFCLIECRWFKHLLFAGCLWSDIISTITKCLLTSGLFRWIYQYFRLPSVLHVPFYGPIWLNSTQNIKTFLIIVKSGYKKLYVAKIKTLQLGK